MGPPANAGGRGAGGMKKRPAAVPIGVGSSSAKKIRVGATRLKVEDTDDNRGGGSAGTQGLIKDEESGVKGRFLKLFDDPNYFTGVSNAVLKEKFKGPDYVELAGVINELVFESRLSMSKTARGELFYTLVSENLASKMTGLDAPARMVYQVIEKAGNMGIWTKIIRNQTNIQQQTLNKIFKTLESRKLIKPVKSVAAKSKKLYMLYELTPAKELTGGVWYSDLEFDHEFISELRAFLLQCVKRLNNGKGVSAKQILEKMVQAKVSKVELSTKEVQQLIETLIYDYMVEEVTSETSEQGDALYTLARRVTPMCDFKWWDALDPGFKFRAIKFEDGVTLTPHEPHYHTA